MVVLGYLQELFSDRKAFQQYQKYLSSAIAARTQLPSPWPTEKIMKCMPRDSFCKV
jgi:hypothetical protein